MVMLALAVVVLLLIAGGLAVVLVRSRGADVSPPRPSPRGPRAALSDARRAGDVLARGRPVGLPAKQLVLREVHDSEIEAQIRSGALLDAITLYREKTGAGLKEAKDAVEAWRDRLRAS